MAIDETVRRIMDEEYQRDKSKDHLYFSPRLTDVGMQEYPNVLHNAIINGNNESFAQDLRAKNLMKSKEKRVNPLGGVFEYRVPISAPENLAEGEFQRYYLRAICRKAIDEGYHKIRIITDKAMETIPDEEKAKIGKIVDIQDLLDDLRQNPYINSRFGIPSPESGLGIEIIK